jgi:hypothetical protein
MTGPEDSSVDVDVEMMGDDELAAALLAGAVGANWSEQAAVDLVVGQGSWLRWREFRQAIDAAVCDNGQVYAWVNWHQVILNVPASSGELRVLAIARSLGGVTATCSLADLLTSLDDTNTARVLRAVSIACQGPDRRSGGGDRQEVLW